MSKCPHCSINIDYVGHRCPRSGDEMSVPPRLIYLVPHHVESYYPSVQTAEYREPWVPKSDYDALQAKLTEVKRLNKVALEAMKLPDGAYGASITAKKNAINAAIKEIEGSKP